MSDVTILSIGVLLGALALWLAQRYGSSAVVTEKLVDTLAATLRRAQEQSHVINDRQLRAWEIENERAVGLERPRHPPATTGTHENGAAPGPNELRFNLDRDLTVGN